MRTPATYYAITAAEWAAICARYGNQCLACGSPGPLVIDHVVPPSKGGKNEAENYQPLARVAGSAKRNHVCDLRPDGAHRSISVPREQVFKPYRPTGKERLILTLPDDLREAFEDLSTRTGSPLAELVRRSMRSYLEQQRPNGKPFGPEAVCSQCGRLAWVEGWGGPPEGPAGPLCSECF